MKLTQLSFFWGKLSEFMFSFFCFLNRLWEKNFFAFFSVKEFFFFFSQVSFQLNWKFCRSYLFCLIAEHRNFWTIAEPYDNWNSSSTKLLLLCFILFQCLCGQVININYIMYNLTPLTPVNECCNDDASMRHFNYL